VVGASISSLVVWNKLITTASISEIIDTAVGIGNMNTEATASGVRTAIELPRRRTAEDGVE
jgi:hypothetical protein